jgi:streptogramin lyase
VACIALGVGTMHAHATKAGEQAPVPARWPAASNLPHAGVTIAMFVHPECPCTRASLASLATAVGDHTNATITIVASNRLSGSTAHLASSVAGARVMLDVDGTEAARFGAKTSGQVVAYDADGHLVFAGGITAARGHIGPNVGASSIASIIAGTEPITSARDVFGCSLREAHPTGVDQQARQ